VEDSMIGDVRAGRCPNCGHRVRPRVMHVETQSLPDPPHTADRYVRFVGWQCLRVEEHRGEHLTTVDDPSQPF
jgi:hypothetical protein